MVESGMFYSTVIDPLLKSFRKRVALEINPEESVIDIACGTGAQVWELARLAKSVTGLDLSESMIRHATKNAEKREITNVSFHVGDATNLSAFYNRNFDVAILSMALHQFKPDLRKRILSEAEKIADRIIFLDYAVPLPVNYVGIASRMAEFMAGIDHNRNFKSYYREGGLDVILHNNGLEIKRSRLLGKGAFQLVSANKKQHTAN